MDNLAELPPSWPMPSPPLTVRIIEDADNLWPYAGNSAGSGASQQKAGASKPPALMTTSATY
jgi:hypothetical protein